MTYPQVSAPASIPLLFVIALGACADTCREVIPVTGHTAGSTLRTRPDSQT